MSTPLKRLEQIIANVRPRKIVLAAEQLGVVDPKLRESVTFVPVVVSPRHVLPSEDKLQELLAPNIYEMWDPDLGKYKIADNPESLFVTIKREVSSRYEEVSDRSAATKRKTALFIKSVALVQQQHIANFLLQLFIDIHSPEWDKKSKAEQRITFETLESLRRTYGKR